MLHNGTTGLGQHCAYPDCAREFAIYTLVAYEHGVGWVHFPQCPAIRQVVKQQ